MEFPRVTFIRHPEFAERVDRVEFNLPSGGVWRSEPLRPENKGYNDREEAMMVAATQLVRLGVGEPMSDPNLSEILQREDHKAKLSATLAAVLQPKGEPEVAFSYDRDGQKEPPVDVSFRPAIMETNRGPEVLMVPHTKALNGSFVPNTDYGAVSSTPSAVRRETALILARNHNAYEEQPRIHSPVMLETFHPELERCQAVERANQKSNYFNQSGKQQGDQFYAAISAEVEAAHPEYQAASDTLKMGLVTAQASPEEPRAAQVLFANQQIYARVATPSLVRAFAWAAEKAGLQSHEVEAAQELSTAVLHHRFPLRSPRGDLLGSELIPAKEQGLPTPPAAELAATREDTLVRG